MKFEIPYQVHSAIELLNNNGYPAHLVGGCVRDFIMGKTPHDYDITTSALPDETIKVFKDYKVIPTGLKHGTVTVLAEEFPLEITTYRIESAYSDNRHPDSVTFTRNLEDDLSRRDFTVNALAYNPDSGITDIFGGVDDIKSQIIRCVGDANQRFSEDALRILRALRFASVLGFDISPDTRDALFANKDLLKNVSAERISEELIKLLCGVNAGKIITEYADILGVIIPEILPMKGFDQKNKHHMYDVLTHTAVAVDNVPPYKIQRLAMFFHDFGKPRCFSIDENGAGHFYGHQKISQSMALDIMTRLRFDNNTKNKVSTLVEWHDAAIENTPKAIKRILNKITPELFFLLLDIKRADTIAHRPDFTSRLTEIENSRIIAESILQNEACFSLKDLAICGNDLIDLGIPAGKKIGELLNIALSAVINEEIKNDKREILSYINDILRKV